MSDPTLVMIGTPAYGGMVHIDYLHSISDYYRNALPFTVMTIGNESLITRARNSILSKFHHSQKHSHLLFLDGDVHLSAQGLQRLLSHGADVVAAAVPLKALNERGERIFNFGHALGESGQLIEVSRVGTAALMLSRKAVDALVATAQREQRVYSRPTYVRGSPLPDTHFDVFRVGVVDGDYLSEDFWVCHQLRALGFRIFIDPQVATRHQGITEF
jgi:hypothetical protein